MDAPKTPGSEAGATQPEEETAAEEPVKPKKRADLPLEKLEKQDSVPSYFENVTDAHGYRWDVRGTNGGLYRGQNSLFDGSLTLEVDGTAFSATEAYQDLKKHQFRSIGHVGDIEVVRDVVVDMERGAGWFLDSFFNAGEKELELSIRFASRFGDSMRDGIFTDSGKRFASSLDSKDSGLLFFSSPTRGSRPSAMFLFAEPKAKNRPTSVSARTTGLTVEWKLKVKAGETKSILQVILQRSLASVDNMNSEMRPLFRRRHLVKPSVPEAMMAKIVNFKISPPDPDGGDADRLIAVNELCDSLDVDREDTDMLWMAKESMLRGKITGGGEISLTTKEGTIAVPLKQVAVLRGGGGRGLQHKVYLRDGTVYVAEAKSKPMKLESPEGWSLDVAIEQLEYLVFHTDKTDGKPPSKGTDFIYLHSGEIAAVDAGDIVLKIVSPWGDVDLPAKQIKTMRYLKDPTPRYRLQLEDGSEFSAFVVNGPMAFNAGRPVSLKRRAGEIAAWWKMSLLPDFSVGFEERDSLEGLKGKLCLLKGSNLLYGTIANEKLHLVSGTTITPLDPKEMAVISRLEESFDEALAVFTIELEGGDSVTGYFKERFIDFRTDSGRVWTLPLNQLIGVQNQDPQSQEEGEEDKAKLKKQETGKTKTTVETEPSPSPPRDPFSLLPSPAAP